jgi:hypothetical protein
MSIIKKIGIFCFVIAALVFAAYSAFWVVVARQLDAQFDTIWVSMGAAGAQTDATKPTAYGYPFPPTITFTGAITEENGTRWTFPELTYRGFPIPGFRMALDAPQGFGIQGPLFPQPVTVDAGYISIALPTDLPRNMDVKNLTAWQQAGGSIPIEALYFKSGELRIEGAGHVTLDEQLQLAGQVDARVVGMGMLLQDLSAREILKGGSVVMAQNFLNALSQEDPVTGERFFVAQIKIQKQGVFFGPLRIGYVPEIMWEAGEQASE